jgi:2-polyprenyl-6-methoxyphenol hydroxylase-like FAD-dependent oxidoreductase
VADIVVAGGGICGLAATLMLARDGHDVTLVDRDPGPVPPSVEAAWEHWGRRSVAQFRMAHLMLARGTHVLRTHLPDVVSALDRHGALHWNIVDVVSQRGGGAPRQPGDERFDMVTGRRSTVEWVLATTVEAEPRVTVRRGAVIDGLETGPSSANGVPHVSGVRLAGGEVLGADVVVDATGRRSPTMQWLAPLGGPPPAEHAEDSGFAYYGRFYRSADGSVPAVLAPPLSPVGSMSVLTIPSDNGTWSVTLYAAAEDAPLRRFRDPDVFERVVRACPAHAHWLDGEPIGDVTSMAGVTDRRRSFVVDGRPVATGLLPVADAWACTNPSVGRGMSLGLSHVALLRDAVRQHLDDPAALATAFAAVTHEQMEPWHAATCQADRARVTEMRAIVAGREPEPDPTLAIGAALGAAAMADPVALRSLAEIQGCHALPAEVFSRPGMLEHVLAVAREHPAAPIPGPDRARLLELVS